MSWAERERIDISKNLWSKKIHVERSLSEIESYNVKLVAVGDGYGYTKEAGVTEISFNGELK